MDTWADRVKALRVKLGMTQQEFAARLGCSYAVIQAWERQVKRPDSYLATRLELLEESAGAESGGA